MIVSAIRSTQRPILAFAFSFLSLVAFASTAGAQEALERVYKVPIDITGRAGVDATTVFTTVGDMGSGTSATKFITRPDGSTAMEVYSRHRIYLNSPDGLFGDYELTAVFRSTFSNYTVTETVLTTGETMLWHSFGAMEDGFFELWFEDGTGVAALTRNPEGFNDGVLIASGTVMVGTGSGYVVHYLDRDIKSGVTAGLMMNITYVNTDYLFEGFEIAEFSIFNISDLRNWDPVPNFALEAGGAAPEFVPDLFTLNWFPDGGILFWNDPNDDGGNNEKPGNKGKGKGKGRGNKK